MYNRSQWSMVRRVDYFEGQTFYVVAPNTLRLDSDETIGIALEGKPVALVTAYIQDYPGKIKNLTRRIDLDVNSGKINTFG
ncbi:hypothetical protein TNCV_160581 [Trichonephila clavipes]|nr:hypothetical protein TNCV_160581 [Trichonephila clavipes]